MKRRFLTPLAAVLMGLLWLAPTVVSAAPTMTCATRTSVKCPCGCCGPATGACTMGPACRSAAPALITAPCDASPTASTRTVARDALLVSAPRIVTLARARTVWGHPVDAWLASRSSLSPPPLA